VRRFLIALLVVVLATTAIVGWRTGWITTASIRAWLDDLGHAGPPLFLLAFVAGALIGLPGMAFVVGGRLAFGPVAGFVLGYGGGVAACLAPFLVARAFPRAASWRPRNRLVQRAFAMVETHPLRAVIALRLLGWFSSPVSYTLALTQVRGRTYLAGCAIALVPVVALLVGATSWFA
jgi:uncharacterized membrane protein YdjX (TVP38/TMEM64 family)